MTERYSYCPACRGRGKWKDVVLLTLSECGRCMGTGIAGGIADLETGNPPFTKTAQEEAEYKTKSRSAKERAVRTAEREEKK